jgi:hypothetical protein
LHLVDDNFQARVADVPCDKTCNGRNNHSLTCKTHRRPMPLELQTWDEVLQMGLLLFFALVAMTLV